MRISTVGVLTAAAMLWLQPFASAQLLQRLEQRLEGVAGRLAQPPQGEQLAPAAQPGYLGLVADETDGEAGVVVLTTRAGSPAEAAGLKKDDVISAINGQAVKNLDDFQLVLDKVVAGQRAQMTVMRGADALTLNATLVARQTPPVNRLGAEDPGPPPNGEGFAPAAAPVPAERADIANARASLGVSVVELTQQARQTYGVTATRGALVASVRAGGPADRVGIPVGAVIVAIDGTRISSPDEVVELVSASRPGQELEVSYYRGATLTRKTVRLSPAAVDARGTPAGVGAAPGVGNLLNGVGGDRPIVRRVGEVLDNLARPAGGAPAGQMEEISALRSQVELLQATVRSLEERIIRLEEKAGDAAPAEVLPNGGARLPPAGDAPVRRPELPLAPPARPALPTPPATP